MKFFRHDTNARNSQFFTGLIHEFGFEGYGRFWALAELCYGQLDQTDSGFTQRCTDVGVWFTFHRRMVQQQLRGTPTTLRRLFDYCETWSDFSWTETGSRWNFRIPNILKRLNPKDKQYWSKYSWDEPKSVLEEKRRTKNNKDKNNKDKIRLEERRKEQIALPAEPAPSPSPDKIFVPPKLHELAEIWNANCGTLSKVKLTNAQRQRRITARWREVPENKSLYWQETVIRIANSDFCNGKNDRGWVATFDWLLKPETHLKVNEGKYDKMRVGPMTFAEKRTLNNAKLYAEYEGSE